MDETGLSFDDDAEAVDMPAVDGAVLPALADSSAYTLENPSHDFEDIPKNPDVSAQAAHTPLQSAVSIVACGSPQKISGTSLRLPIKLKLSQDGSECLITITISLDDMPF